jgi:photosystem II stability/assembly factor-like uncharacterized protein
MRSLIPAFLVLIAAGGTASAEWESLGPEGGEVRHIVQSVSDASTLFGFSNSYPTQVVRSTDGGSTWSNAGTFNNNEYSAAMGSGGRLYAGCGSAFATSDDAGSTWTLTSISNTYFYGIAPHPSVANTVYAAGYRYNGSAWVLCFMSSTNGGSGWSTVDIGAANTYGQSISVSATDPDLMFVSGYAYTGSTYNPIVYRSLDGGGTWVDVTPAASGGEYYSYSVAVSPVDDDLVLFGSYYNMYRSTNGGSSWTRVTSNQYYNYSIAFSAADPAVIYAGGYGSVYRSVNSGLTWSSFATGLPSQPMQSVMAHRTDATTAFCGLPVGFYRSTTSGTSWVASNTGLCLGRILAIETAPSQPSRIYKQIYGLGIWRSMDDGSSWTHLTTPLSCGDFCDIEVKPDDPNTVLCLEGSG